MINIEYSRFCFLLYDWLLTDSHFVHCLLPLVFVLLLVFQTFFLSLFSVALLSAKPMDLDSLGDLKKQRVKVLKKVLGGWNEKCEGCTSKDDYIRRINELRSKHAPKEEL